MPRYFLTKVRVEGFRGINNEGEPLELKFRPDTVNSVFAANGAGKSSLFEALCYAIYGSVPKLESLQADERREGYYNNRFHSQGTARIDLEFQADDGSNSTVAIRVERDGTGNRQVSSPSGAADPEGFLSSLREDFALLDYGTFTRFIDESPLDRGRSFSSLLGLSSYSHMRQALQAASETRALNTDLELKTLENSAAAEHEMSQRALDVVRSSYEGVTGKSLTDIARLEECKAEVHAALSSVALVQEHFTGRALEQVDFDAVKRTIREEEGGENRRQYEQLVGRVSKLSNLGDSDAEVIRGEQKALAELVDQRDGLIAATRGESFQKLYQAAQVVLDSGDWDNDRECPLCESDLEMSIREHVSGQISQYKEVAKKNEEIREAWRSATWVRRLQQLETSEPLEVPQKERLTDTVNQRVNRDELTKEDITSAIDFLTRLEKRRADWLADLEKQKQDLEARLPPSYVQLTEKIEQGKQFRDNLVLHLNKKKEEERLRSKLGIRQRWRDFINQAATKFAAAESELSRTRIAAIDSEYKAMFRQIMSVGDVVPELQRAGSDQKLNVQLRDFHGQGGLSARALLSESYRNALAISVFLGAAMKHSGTPRFVVLDDVTSSFDAGHQYQLMELIRQRLQQPGNTDGLQFILLSHDGLLEKYFDSLSNTAGWHHHRLEGLPPIGNVVSNTQNSNRLRTLAESHLNAGQTRQAEPLIRQYLEFRLLQVIQKLNIPVPFDFAIKDQKRMVGNCIKAINAAIDLHSRAGTLILDSQQLSDLNNIHVPSLVGNWVSHYETASTSSLSPHVLRSILQSIDDFTECFRYDDTSGSRTQRRWYRSLSSR